MADNWVLGYAGVPPVGAFGGTSGAGSPLVVDVTTDKIYYLIGNVVTEVGGGGGGGGGTVTSVSVVTANGISGSVANPTTTPAITLTLGAITPTSVAASGAITGSNLSGTNTGDQTSIVGITGSLAEFNAALTGADFATGGGTATGANTGDQTSIVGITGTKAQFDTSVTDGNFLFVGDITQYTDEQAQDATGAMVASSTFVSLTYNDATPSLTPSLSATGTPSGTTFLRGDNTWATPPGGGGGTTITSGVTTINFGAFPGASDTSLTITGQAGIVAGSKVKAYLLPTDTVDHSADEHWVETLEVMAGNIIAATGFTIWAKNTNTLSEPVSGQWANTRLAGPGTGVKQIRPDLGGGRGTRLYGQYTIAWEWF